MVVNNREERGSILIPSPTTNPVVLIAVSVDQLQKLADLTQGKGIPDKKSDTKPPLAEDEDKKNDDEEENKQTPTNVMQAAGTPAEYSPISNTFIQEADSCVQVKRDCCQVILRKLFHLIQTNNLVGLLKMRLLESDLDQTLQNMINDAIDSIFDQWGIIAVILITLLVQ